MEVEFDLVLNSLNCEPSENRLIVISSYNKYKEKLRILSQITNKR